MDRDNQLGASAGRGFHARFQTVVISLVFLQTCIAPAYATPAPLQQCNPSRASVLQEVTAGSERSLTDRAHHCENYLTATHFCHEHTHVSDEPILNTRDTLRPSNRTAHDSNAAECQLPCLRNVSLETDWLLYHKAYWESVKQWNDCYAGPAFLRCHSRTTASLHKGIHNTSRVNPISAINRQHMTARWNKGLKAASLQAAGLDTSAPCNSNCFKSSCDLKQLAGLQYSNFNVNGAAMETSVSDPKAWTQHVMFEDIANTPVGAQQGLASCRKYVSNSVRDTHPDCEFKVAESKCYLDPRAKGRIILKLTLKPDLAADFIAKYDSQGSPLASLTIVDKQGNPFQGAPTTRLYSDQKFEDSHKVKMAVYIEGTEIGDSSKRLSERVASMHELFMREAYNGLVEIFSTGKLHSHSLAH